MRRQIIALFCSLFYSSTWNGAWYTVDLSKFLWNEWMNPPENSVGCESIGAWSLMTFTWGGKLSVSCTGIFDSVIPWGAGFTFFQVLYLREQDSMASVAIFCNSVRSCSWEFRRLPSGCIHPAEKYQLAEAPFLGPHWVLSRCGSLSQILQMHANIIWLLNATE